jgi:uncharacterized protein YbjT (DUF2867 family)
LDKVIIFGATGMVGQGVLRECLLDPGITRLVTVGRSAPAQEDPKLRKLIHPASSGYESLEAELSGLDACFFCLGVSSNGMKEEDYRRITYDYTLAPAQTLARLNPAMVFIYVSGAGTDSTEQRSTMWARVKGATENALCRLPFRAVYLFRPGMIQPLHGIRSKTRLYDAIYTVFGFLMPMLRRLFPRSIVTTEQVGVAMIRIARAAPPTQILGPSEIAVWSLR